MGKKNKTGDLGKALLKDRYRSSKPKRGSSSMLHTADVNDGYEWDRLNLASVTEENSLSEFLSTAQLAGTEFHAEKLNIKYVNPDSGIGLLTNDEMNELIKIHKSNQDLLKIPRRPKWDDTTTREELKIKENNEFLEWRKQLALLQQSKDLMLTPYEKNLEFWKQLWRVIERSDVIVQIVDARNPLLFRCPDLEKYVKEVNENKINMILVNKADFLTDDQRQAWADYFTKIGMKVAFFSALETANKNKKLSKDDDDDDDDETGSETIEEEEEEEEEEESDDDDDSDEDGKELDEEEDKSNYGSDFASESEYESADDGLNETVIMRNNLEESESLNETVKTDSNKYKENSPEILTKEQLIEMFKSMKHEIKGDTFMKSLITIGLVGYPNVGKSSTINAIFEDKKVSVSATPGKTKHFQTLYVDKELLLCDCPGLVMPSFVCTKAEMVLNGILPIDQMRDHVPPVTLVGTLIPRHIIEDTYGIMLPEPIDGEDPDRPPTAEEILNTYGYNRGFMTQNGQPNNPRSARYVLKDFVTGKLLYCVAPPDTDQEKYHTFPPRRKIISENRVLPDRQIRASRGSTFTQKDLDSKFFQNNSSGFHVKNIPGQINALNLGELGSKPWKKINKHVNKKKKEKTRRLFAHLDQH